MKKKSIESCWKETEFVHKRVLLWTTAMALSWWPPRLSNLRSCLTQILMAYGMTHIRQLVDIRPDLPDHGIERPCLYPTSEEPFTFCLLNGTLCREHSTALCLLSLIPFPVLPQTFIQECSLMNILQTDFYLHICLLRIKKPVQSWTNSGELLFR